MKIVCSYISVSHSQSLSPSLLDCLAIVVRQIQMAVQSLHAERFGTWATLELE